MHLLPLARIEIFGGNFSLTLATTLLALISEAEVGEAALALMFFSSVTTTTAAFLTGEMPPPIGGLLGLIGVPVRTAGGLLTCWIGLPGRPLLDIVLAVLNAVDVTADVGIVVVVVPAVVVVNNGSLLKRELGDSVAIV